MRGSRTRRARVLLADDHPLMRSALGRVLGLAGHRVIAEVADGETAVRLAGALLPDLVLLDLRMPGAIDGLEATRRIVAASPEVRVAVISGHAGVEAVAAAERAGAAAFIAKGAGAQEILDIVMAVLEGRSYDGPAEGGTTLRPARSRVEPVAPAPSELDKLTRREREILRLVAQEHSSVSVASVLRLSVRTVETHRQNIMTKLGIHSVAGLTGFAIRNGLV